MLGKHCDIVNKESGVLFGGVKVLEEVLGNLEVVSSTVEALGDVEARLNSCSQELMRSAIIDSLFSKSVDGICVLDKSSNLLVLAICDELLTQLDEIFNISKAILEIA